MRAPSVDVRRCKVEGDLIVRIEVVARCNDMIMLHCSLQRLPIATVSLILWSMQIADTNRSIPVK